MASEVLNYAKGRQIALHDRVNDNDPANAVLVIALLKAAEADATLRDYDDLATLLGAAGNTEADFTNYARKILTDADIGPSTVDDTNDRRAADMPDQTWSSAGGAVNNTLVKLLVCYDGDSTGGTDSNVEAVAQYDFAITTNGGDIQAQVDAAGYVLAA